MRRGRERPRHLTGENDHSVAQAATVEDEDEKRPTDDHSRTGLNAATIMAGLSYPLDTYREVARYLKHGYFMRISTCSIETGP